LFQGRYKALLVDIDEYAQELSRYIHFNPVSADMVEKPEQFKWSSYKYFLEKPDLEQIIEQTATVFGEDPALLKRVQIYLCHKFSGQRLKDIGIHFGIGLSGVSQASR
jgi:hypothetical protein